METNESYEKQVSNPYLLTLHKIGSSMMLVMGLIPVASILYGIGYYLINRGINGVLIGLMMKVAYCFLENIPLLFAVCIPNGVADKSHEGAGLAGLVSWLTIMVMLDPATVGSFVGADAVNPAFYHIRNTFFGIVAGTIGAQCYMRFSEVELPEMISFFSGKRLVPILSVFFSFLTSMILYIFWPILYSFFDWVGEELSALEFYGVGIYTTLNRLLLPFGLHHAINDIFWHHMGAGLGDMDAFWNGTGTLGVTGVYMTGFFPIFMFGLPAAALAMLHTAKKNQKKKIFSLLLSAALASFMTGITEPVELTILLLAPGLYIVHAFLSGIIAVLCAVSPMRLGFNFSAGLVDLMICSDNPLATNSFWLLPIGVLTACVYYLIFRVVIEKFDLKTPGREELDEEEIIAQQKLAGNEYTSLAWIILDGLGGKANIDSLTMSEKELVAALSDFSKLDDKRLKMSGATSSVSPVGAIVHIQLGSETRYYYEELLKMMTDRG